METGVWLVEMILGEADGGGAVWVAGVDVGAAAAGRTGCRPPGRAARMADRTEGPDALLGRVEMTGMDGPVAVVELTERLVVVLGTWWVTEG